MKIAIGQTLSRPTDAPAQTRLCKVHLLSQDGYGLGLLQIYDLSYL